MRVGPLALMLAALLCPNSAAAQPAKRLALTRILFSLNESDSIGKLRSGLICGPAGLMSWSDLARPSDLRIRQTLQRSVSPVRLSVADESKLPTYFDDDEVRATVEQLRGELCVAGLGLGERKPKGKLTLTTRWDVISASSGRLLDSRQTEVSAEFESDFRTDAQPLLTLLAASAQKFGGDDAKR